MTTEQNSIQNNKIDEKKTSLLKALKIGTLVTVLLLFIFLIFGGWKLFAPWLIEISTSTPDRTDSISSTFRKIFASFSWKSENLNGRTGKLINDISSNGVVVFTNKQDYYTGDSVEYIIRNNSDTSKIIYSPFYAIEKFDDKQQSWTSLKTKDECPCGALCKSAHQLLLQPKHFLYFKWNQKEEWCNDEKSGDNQTITRQVPLGKYRIAFEVGEKSDNGQLSKHKIYSETFTIFETTEYRINDQGQYISEDGKRLDNFHIELSEVEITSDTEAEFSVENVRDLFIERLEFTLNYNEDIDYIPNRSTLLYQSSLAEDVKLSPYSKKKISIYAHLAALKENFGKSFIITPVVQAVWLRK